MTKCEAGYFCDRNSFAVALTKISVFAHPIFRFWFLVTFGDEVTKIQKYYLIFVYIWQGKMGKTKKNWKKITQLKWPKYPKPKDENMGWTKHKTAKVKSEFCQNIRWRGILGEVQSHTPYLFALDFCNSAVWNIQLDELDF